MTKLKVGVEPEPEIEFPPDYPHEDPLSLARFFYRRESYPPEWWELLELTMAGCPDEPLRAFRKSLIGKGNPLTAKQADDAISAALKTMGVTAKREPIKIRNQGLVIAAKVNYPEARSERLARARWFLRNDRTVIFVKPQGAEHAVDEKVVIRDAIISGVPLSFLEWDDSAVDRVAAPDGTHSVLMPSVQDSEKV